MFARGGLNVDAHGEDDNTLLYKLLAATQWLVCIHITNHQFTEYSAACLQLVIAWQLLNHLLRHESVADSERH